MYNVVIEVELMFAQITRDLWYIEEACSELFSCNIKHHMIEESVQAE